MKSLILLMAACGQGLFPATVEDYYSLEEAILSRPKSEWEDTSDPETKAIRDCVSSPDFAWDSKSFPGVFQNDGYLYPLSHRFGHTGVVQPNDDPVWQSPGGFHNVRGIRFKKAIKLPPGKRIRLFLGHREIPDSHIVSTELIDSDYPVGTVVTEAGRDLQGRNVIVRGLIKVGDQSDEWQGREYWLSEKPPGYVEIGDCRECHVQGHRYGALVKHPLSVSESYLYGTLRGPFIFGLHPFDGGEVVRDRGIVYSRDVRHLYDYSGLPEALRPRWDREPVRPNVSRVQVANPATVTPPIRLNTPFLPPAPRFTIPLPGNT